MTHRRNLDLIENPAQFLADLHRAAQVGIRQDGDELLAPEAGDEIRFAHGVSKTRRDLLQYLVTTLMTVTVVDLLEVVDVDHQY